jgi:cytidine deaminase
MATGSTTTLQASEVGLCRKALLAAKTAFAPISGFAVGAIILTEDGREFAGQNQENSAFDSIHAEMAALANWNSAGEPRIETIAIVGFKFWPTHEMTIVVTPCGRCRQWLYEALIRSKSDPQIICASADLASVQRFHIQNLLPYGFSMEERKSMYHAWYEKMRQHLRKI